MFSGFNSKRKYKTNYKNRHFDVHMFFPRNHYSDAHIEKTYHQKVSLGTEYYNLLITLDKNKKTCTYKEKIYQSTGYQMLSCNFEMGQLNTIADIMENFNNAYKNEIAKNKIYEAKLTNSAEILEKYLINPKYCQITQSRTK